MSNNLYMAFHPGDYLTDTAHLSTLEHGAYLLLIMNYWQRGEPLPLDDRKLRGIARMTAAEWAESRETLLEFFTEREGVLHHKRIDEELAKATQRSSAARANAELSHSARRANAKRPQSDGKADAKPPHSVRSANQDQDQEQEEAIASSGADEAKIPLSEMIRRLEQATGWTNIPGEGAIETLVSEGFSFEGRILPLARDEGVRRADPPRSWSYLATVVRDRTRVPTPSAKPVETVWIPMNSPALRALIASGRKESYFRLLAKPGPGGDGFWWPASDLPPASDAAA